MNNIFDLIPKDKFDDSNIEILKTIDTEKAEPILSYLLEWIKDINWPVAQILINDVLPRFHANLIPHIQAVFNSDDDIWKCWVLCLIEKFPAKTMKCLLSDIKRISDNPTAGEIEEEANIYAAKVIQMFKL